MRTYYIGDVVTLIFNNEKLYYVTKNWIDTEYDEDYSRPGRLLNKYDFLNRDYILYTDIFREET
jgi:hypothetical protein